MSDAGSPTDGEMGWLELAEMMLDRANESMHRRGSPGTYSILYATDPHRLRKRKEKEGRNVHSP